MRRRLIRIGLAVALVTTGLVAIVLAVVHLPAVQRVAFDRLTRSVATATGWSVTAGEVRLRLLPASLRMENVEVSAGAGTVARVARLEAHWRWRELTASPPRLVSLEVVAPVVDLRALPPSPTATADEAGGLDPGGMLAAFELGQLRLVDGSARAAAAGIDFEGSGVRVVAGLRAARLSLTAAADRVAAVREGRTLTAGPIDVALAGGADRLRLEHLDVAGKPVAIRLDGTTTLAPALGADLEVALEADVVPILAWWDPELAASSEIAGVLRLAGHVRYDDQGLRAEFEHHGPPLRVAGYRVDTLTASSAGGVLEASLGGADWGRAGGTFEPGGELRATASIEALDLVRLARSLPFELPVALPSDAVASGDLEIATRLPPTLETVAGAARLDVRWGGGAARVEARASDGAVEVTRFEATVAGAELSGSGRLSASHTVRAQLAVEVPNPSRLDAACGELLGSAPIGIAGGAAHLDATVSGTLDMPAVQLAAGWDQPAYGELCARRLDLSASAAAGGAAVWEVFLVPFGAGTVYAAGTTDLGGFATAAEWQATLPDLAAAATGVATVLPDVDIRGELRGRGTMSWQDGTWQVGAHVDGRGVGSGPWQLDAVEVDLIADPGAATVSQLHAELAGGAFDGHGEVGLTGFDDAIALQLEGSGFDVARLPLTMPEAISGIVDLAATVSGTVGRPVVDFSTAWNGNDAAGSVRSLELHMALADGVAELSLPRLATAAGTLSGRGDAPLGDLPLPVWLWPDAPAGPLRLTLVGTRLQSDPLIAALGQPKLPAELTTDLNVDISWDLSDPAARFAEVRFEGLEVVNAVETLRAPDPVVLRVDGTRAVLEPATLAGARSRIEASGSYTLASGEIVGHATATLAPEMAQLLPVAVQVHEPLQLAADVEGTAAELTGTVEVRHPGGRFVMRDPALSIENLALSLVFEDGALWIEEGSATVNRGTVLLGGGWDPASGQGIVIEMDDVVALLPFDILTHWSGDLAIAPDPERLLTVSGDLVLEGGVWDRPVDLTGFVFGPTTMVPAADDPLWDIGLDLDVRGRGGLAVDNNLGVFQVTWNLLEVRGTAAQPSMVGDLAIAPGGTLNLAGQRVTVRRGTIGFTGDPVSDPVIEIVPVNDVAAFGVGEAGEGGGFDTGMMARRGVAQGLGSVLGLENETLRPAEIAIETDTTTTTSFTAGQRLSRYVALFLTTNLADVQDSTTMVQLWNFPALPGVALQAWDRTGEDSSGANLIERFSWGGTGGSGSTDDRPTVHSIHLEGDWPVWKWRLKRKLGLSRGEPYEPFLGFAAGLRLERELAARGWQLARVDFESEGPDRLPSLTYRVEPGPRRQLEFVGDTPPDHVRREVTAIYQPPPLERSAFKGMVDILERYYRSEGFPNADVTIERRDEAIVATVERGAELQYEGPQVEGVPPPQAESIRRVLGSPSELVSLLEDPDRGAAIVQRILHTQGYRQAELRRVWAERVADDVSRVYMEVAPGPRTTIHELLVSGDDPLDLAHSQEVLAAGQPLDRLQIEFAADRIRRRYLNAGYVNADVNVRYRGTDSGPWDVELELAPGAARTVGEIRFKGHKSIGRKTLLKGVAIAPGEPLRLGELDQSVIDLASFAPIERVNTKVTPSGPTTSDVEFLITERPRWTVEAGTGWSTDRGVEGRFGIRDGGLFGRGGSVYLRGRWQRDEQLLLLNAELPPLPGSRLSYGTSLSYRRRDAPTNPDKQREDILTGSIELTREFGSGVSFHPYYQLSHTVKSAKDPDDPFGFFLEGTLDVATLGAQLRSDRLDNPFDPRSGTYVGLDVGWSSSLFGSDLETLKTLLTATAALEPRSGWTWAQTLRLGAAKGLEGTDVDPDVRFLAGGQGSIRGFEKDLVGPVTIDYNGKPQPDGGSALLVLNEELRIPIWNGLRGAVFTDIGQVWESWSQADLELSVGVGLGLRYTTPIGPLWADVAWPVVNQGYSSGGPRYYVGIGRPF